MAKAGLELCVNNYFPIAGSGHSLPLLAQASWEKREQGNLEEWRLWVQAAASGRGPSCWLSLELRWAAPWALAGSANPVLEAWASSFRGVLNPLEQDPIQGPRPGPGCGSTTAPIAGY